MPRQTRQRRSLRGGQVTNLPMTDLPNTDYGPSYALFQSPPAPSMPEPSDGRGNFVGRGGSRRQRRRRRRRQRGGTTAASKTTGAANVSNSAKITAANAAVSDANTKTALGAIDTGLGGHTHAAAAESFQSQPALVGGRRRTRRRRTKHKRTRRRRTRRRRRRH
jgi:hypothetical protein